MLLYSAERTPSAPTAAPPSVPPTSQVSECSASPKREPQTTVSHEKFLQWQLTGRMSSRALRQIYGRFTTGHKGSPENQPRLTPETHRVKTPLPPHAPTLHGARCTETRTRTRISCDQNRVGSCSSGRV